MKKVLLVDDEKHILEMLKNMIDWEFHGFSIVGTAENAKDAMKLYYQETPDIIITDICMDEISGIEFITRIRIQNSVVKIIILSAYDKFEYAQKAVKLGVDGYLLKPIQKDDLLSAVIEAANKIHSKIDYQNEIDQLKVSLDDLQKKYLEEQLLNVYKGRIEEIPSELDQDDFWTVLSIRTIVRDDIVFLERDIRKQIRDAIYLLFVEDGIFALMIRSNKNDHENILNSLGEIIKKYCTVEKSMMIGVTSIQYGKNLRKACMESREILNKLFYKDEQYYSSYLGAQSHYDEKQIPEAFDKEHFLLKILNAEYDACNTHFEDYLNKCAVQNERREQVIEYFKQCILIIHTYVKKDFQKIEIENVIKIAEKADRSSELLDYFKQCIDILKKDNVQLNKSDAVITKAKSYIRENCLNETFTIDVLAENLKISKSYLSKLFKNETGESIWNYVIRIRITHAKEMMMNTDATNYEVAKAIGYASEYHFSRAFSKFVGVSPSVYKKMYMRIK